jgi:hypothetical protein
MNGSGVVEREEGAGGGVNLVAAWFGWRHPLRHWALVASLVWGSLKIPPLFNFRGGINRRIGSDSNSTHRGKMDRTLPGLETSGLYCGATHLTFEQSHVAGPGLVNCKEVSRHHHFRRSVCPFRKEMYRPTALHLSGNESTVDGLGGLCSDTAPPFVLPASNRPKNIDPAVLRRAPTHNRVDVPTPQERKEFSRCL